MNEEEFDSSHNWVPFTTEAASQMGVRLRRSAALSFALFGGASDDLPRQLRLPHPEIPRGFDLADFRELHRWIQTIAEIPARLAEPRYAWLSRSSIGSLVGPDSLTVWEAKLEIVRRAIDYLEKP